MASQTRSVFRGFQQGLARQNLAGHGRGMRCARAAENLHQGFLDNALLDVQCQFATALMRRAAAHTMRQSGYILDFISLDPLAFFRNGSRAVFGSLGHADHVFNGIGLIHAYLACLALLYDTQTNLPETSRAGSGLNLCLNWHIVAHGALRAHQKKIVQGSYF